MTKWNKQLAEAVAHEENLVLTPAHWEIIELARNYYAEYEHIPPLRLFIKTVGAALGKEKASSLYLYRLFPDGPLKQICRIAGLPKPRHCL